MDQDDRLKTPKPLSGSTSKEQPPDREDRYLEPFPGDGLPKSPCLSAMLMQCANSQKNLADE